MTGHRGTYLDPELSVRLAILDNVDRDKIIAHIVAQMRSAEQITPGVQKLKQDRERILWR